MTTFRVSWYVLIKLMEWVIWWGIGFYFLSRAFPSEARHPKITCAVAIGFFIFGGADFIEYFTAGRFPLVALGLEDCRRACSFWPARHR